MSPFAAHALDVRRRLMTPPNAVVDRGIDLRQQRVARRFTIEGWSLQMIHFFGRGLAPRRKLPVLRGMPIYRIKAAVCREFGISMADLISARRNRVVCTPRQIAMALSKHLSSRSFPIIGQQFGGRDHTTIIHAVRKYAVLINEVAARMSDSATPEEWASAVREQMGRRK